MAWVSGPQTGRCARLRLAVSTLIDPGEPSTAEQNNGEEGQPMPGTRASSLRSGASTSLCERLLVLCTLVTLIRAAAQHRGLRTRADWVPAALCRSHQSCGLHPRLSARTGPARPSRGLKIALCSLLEGFRDRRVAASRSSASRRGLQFRSRCSLTLLVLPLEHCTHAVALWLRKLSSTRLSLLSPSPTACPVASFVRFRSAPFRCSGLR